MRSRERPPRRSHARLKRCSGWLTALVLSALLETASAGAQVRATATQDLEELMRKGGCMLCHRWSRAWIGPSFKEIAHQHQGATAPERQVLAERLRRGSVGNHTPIPMGACDVSRLSDEELRLVIDHVLENGLRKDLARR